MPRMLKVLGLFSILAVLNLATVCVFLSAIPARAGLTEPEVCLQGDINGDGSRTLADALKLLNFLFQEGPEPVACAEPPVFEPTLIWPPAPEVIVVETGSFTWVDDRDSEVVYTVPKGFCFVGTVRASAIVLESTNDGLRWRQVNANVIADPDTGPLTAAGWTLVNLIPPGTELSVEVSGLGVSNGADESKEVNYMIHGYLVDADTGHMESAGTVPPHPSQVVLERGSDALEEIGDELELYEVPEGNVFVMTRVSVDSSLGDSSGGNDAKGTGGISVLARGKIDREVIPAFVTMEPEISGRPRDLETIGIPFEPGSKVVIVYSRSSDPESPDKAPSHDTLGWSIEGYLLETSGK